MEMQTIADELANASDASIEETPEAEVGDLEESTHDVDLIEHDIESVENLDTDRWPWFPFVLRSGRENV